MCYICYVEGYKIKIQHFEGPFDLLLFFIERDELDIYDIPIAKITNDFLEYIKAMEQMSIDLASEFIVVAATLCRIKAKLLLPRKSCPTFRSFRENQTGLAVSSVPSRPYLTKVNRRLRRHCFQPLRDPGCICSRDLSPERRGVAAVPFGNAEAW